MGGYVVFARKGEVFVADIYFVEVEAVQVDVEDVGAVVRELDRWRFGLGPAVGAGAELVLVSGEWCLVFSYDDVDGFGVGETVRRPLSIRSSILIASTSRGFLVAGGQMVCSFSFSPSAMVQLRSHNASWDVVERRR